MFGQTIIKDITLISNGSWIVETETRWRTAKGEAPRLRRGSNGRIERDYPSSIYSVLPDAVRDISNDIEEAAAVLCLYSKSRKITWPCTVLSSTSELDESKGFIDLVVTSRHKVDPNDLGPGNVLESGVWSIKTWTRFLHFTQARSVQFELEDKETVGRGFALQWRKHGTSATLRAVSLSRFTQLRVLKPDGSVERVSFDSVTSVGESGKILIGGSNLSDKRTMKLVEAAKKREWSYKRLLSATAPEELDVHFVDGKLEVQVQWLGKSVIFDEGVPRVV